MLSGTIATGMVTQGKQVPEERLDNEQFRKPFIMRKTFRNFRNYKNLMQASTYIIYYIIASPLDGHVSFSVCVVRGLFHISTPIGIYI